MRCVTCGRPIDTEKTWFVLERGVIVHGQPIAADRPMCSEECRDAEGSAA